MKAKLARIQSDEITNNRCSIHLNDDEIKMLINCLEVEAKKGNADINPLIKLIKRFNPSVFDATKKKENFTFENGIQLLTVDSKQHIFLQSDVMAPSKVLQQSLENDTRNPSLQEQVASHSLPANKKALLDLLEEADLFSEQNAEIVINGLDARDLDNIVAVLRWWKHFDFLQSQKTFDFVVSKETVNLMFEFDEPANCVHFIAALSILRQADLLTEDNKKALAQHTNILQLMLSLGKLKENNLLDQHHFLTVLRPIHQTRGYSVVVKKHFTQRAYAQSWTATIEREKKVDGQKPTKEILLRHHISSSENWKSGKIIAQTNSAHRHPNHIRPLVVENHREGTVDIDAEFADAGPLYIYVPTFSSKDRLIAAKSIARLLAVSLMYFDGVHDHLHHRNINPTTIFLRRDGCVKLGFFDLIGPQEDNEKQKAENPEKAAEDTQCREAAKQKHMTDNADWYFRNPFVAPEYQPKDAKEITADEMDKRIRCDEKADVWAVGATVISVLLGKTLLPQVEMKKYDEDSAPVPTSEQRRRFENEKKWFAIIQEAMQQPTYSEALDQAMRAAPMSEEGQQLEQLLTPFIQKLKESPELAYFLHRCLQTKPEDRISLADANALIHIFGGTCDELSAIEKKIQEKADAEKLLSESSESEQQALKTKIQNLETDIRKLLPPTWATPKDVLETKQVVEVQLAGPAILLALNTEAPLWVKDDKGQLHLTDEGNAARIKIAEAKTNELTSWKKERDVEAQRSTVDKAMRDAVKASEKAGWIGLQTDIANVRAKARKENNNNSSSAVDKVKSKNSVVTSGMWSQHRPSAGADPGAAAAARAAPG